MIRDLCKDMCFNRIYNWNNIPNEMLLNVSSSLGINDDKLVLFYDSSVLETGRTGLAISDDGVHWKDISSPPGHLNWEEFMDIDINHDDHYIYFGDQEGVFVFHRDVELLLELLATIKQSKKESYRAEGIIKS